MTTQEQIVLRRFAGAMIGACDDLQIPGADDEVIFGRMLDEARRMITRLRRGMSGFLEQFGGVARVAVLDDSEFDSVVEVARQANHPFLGAMIALVAEAYYTDPRILFSLKKEDRPPFPKGNTLEQGDWSLLDPVMARGPVYRDC
ncbi:MAG: hypothetical protein GY925_07230 [Actinomycetia bacterium]|nr:hypothetical protein [Actinomycetes bacterium]